MKRVLVTGANGFIGRSIVPLLMKKDMEVHCIDIKSPEESIPGVCWHQINLIDAEKMLKLMLDIKPTHLLHFAWFAVPDKYWTSPENIRWVQASLALLQGFAQSGGQRVVMAGTCAEYDWNYGYCSEDLTPLKPATLYGICKHSLQMLLSAFSVQTGLSSAWGRIFFLYGPYEYPDRLVPSVVRSLLNGTMAKCSLGEQLRDFLHVQDVASAFVSILESEICGPVNIGSGNPIKIKDMVLMIGEKIGCIDLIDLDAIPTRPNDPILLLPNIHKLHHEIGWKPTHTISSGLSDTIEWWQSKELV